MGYIVVCAAALTTCAITFQVMLFAPTSLPSFLLPPDLLGIPGGHVYDVLLQTIFWSGLLSSQMQK